MSSHRPRTRLGSAGLVCYELNEVPWRVVDRHVAKRPQGTLARLLARSDQYTTRTVDGGELHPWTTWPTLHRGVANDVHGIHSLNQDLSGAAPWPPVWTLLNDAGISTGVCGSLQSYPPVRHPAMRFHVPDTFAAGPETSPSRYEPFQALNLRQTGNNTAVTSRVGLADARGALGLLRTGIRTATVARVARHLLAERREPLHTRRRPLLQPELAFDVFMDCLRRDPPRFATFFSNHVAGIMHRYWRYSFPEDYAEPPPDDDAARFHAESLHVAMDAFERHLDRLLPWCRRHGHELVICSSMGQEAVDRGAYVPELRIADFARLCRAVGWERPVRMNLAMHPDVAFEFDCAHDLAEFRAVLEGVRDPTGMPLFSARYEPVGTTLNMWLAVSAALARDPVVGVGGEAVAVADAGLELFERDVGTGYHQPEGILIWHHGRDPVHRDRAVVDSRRVAPTLLRFFGVEPPRYMYAPVAGALSGEAAPEAA